MSVAAPARPRIVHLMPLDGIGGVEVAARSMAARDDLACDFHLLLIAGSTLARGCSRVVEGRAGGALHPLAQARAVAAVLRLQPDVLICSLWRSVPVALAVKALRPRTKLVAFLHLDRPVHAPDAMATRALVAAADAIWCDSAATLQRYAQLRTPRCVISFVTDRPLRSAPSAGPRPHFVSWSRLTPQKAIDRSVRLIAALRGRGVAATLDIWGPDGGSKAELARLVAALDLGEAVRLRGPAPREALPGIAADASFFLHPSRFEGMAMAVVEAMQLGLVPVTTAAGQMADYVRPGATGVLIDPERLDEAADAIIALLADPAAYARLRDGAVRHWLDAPLYADDVCAAARACMAA